MKYLLMITLITIGGFVHAEADTEVEETRTSETRVEADVDEDSGLRPRLGFEGGMIFSNISAPKDIKTDQRTGVAAGVNLEVPLSHRVSVQPGALFVQRGADIHGPGVSRAAAKLNSLEVPVLLKMKFNPDFSPFIAAGPLFNWNISQNVAGADVGFSSRSYDFGATVGGGLDLGAFSGMVRYTWGLTSMNESAAGWDARGLYVLVGVRI